MPKPYNEGFTPETADISEETRECPICGEMLKKPYWKHMQKKHPEEYHSNRATWVQLYKDYTAMGMTPDMSIMVISELFNARKKDIKGLLKKEKIL